MEESDCSDHSSRRLASFGRGAFYSLQNHIITLVLQESILRYPQSPLLQLHPFHIVLKIAVAKNSTAVGERSFGTELDPIPDRKNHY